MFRLSLPDGSSSRVISVFCKLSNCRLLMMWRVMLQAGPDLERSRPSAYAGLLNRLMPCGWDGPCGRREDGKRKGISFLRGWGFGVAGEGRGGERPVCLRWNPTREERKKAAFFPKQYYLIERSSGVGMFCICTVHTALKCGFLPHFIILIKM